MRLVKASEMQDMDRKTIQDLGLPGMVLMENAGRGSARFFLEQFSPSVGQKVLVLCGSGNNGGDGYVVVSQATPAPTWKSPSPWTWRSAKFPALKSGAVK